MKATVTQVYPSGHLFKKSETLFHLLSSVVVLGKCRATLTTETRQHTQQVLFEETKDINDPR